MSRADQAEPAVEPGGADPDSRFASFVEELAVWAGCMPGWPPSEAIARLWQDVGPRLAASVEEAGRPLVVGVLGGTGTGKSTLVNALAGRDVSEASDVARPTTVQPVVVASGDVDLGWFPLEALGASVVRTDVVALAEIVLVDCPDPDTQSPEHAASPATHTEGRADDAGNRDRLEQILPHCDVLLVISTAQKYRSFSVARELAAFAPGRPLLFVQTHASRDPDIRDDWKRDLETQGFVVPVIYRVDGLEAFRRSGRGEAADPAFASLQSAIAGELASREAARIRRNGGLELAGWFLQRGGEQLQPVRVAVQDLREGLNRETARLEALLSQGIALQVRQARLGWRHLVARELEQQWQAGAFGWFLQVVANVRGWLPKSRRQLTGLVGRVLAGQGASLGQVTVGGDVAASSEALDEALGLDDAEVEQSRSVLVGLARRAGIEPPLVQPARLEPAGQGGVAVTLERGQRWLSSGIKSVAAGCRERIGARWLQVTLEGLFDAVVAAVVLRAAWDFFHGRLWLGESRGGLLTEAVIWLTLWGLLLRQVAIVWASRQLNQDTQALCGSLREADLVEPLLNDMRQAADAAQAFLNEQHRLHTTWSDLLHENQLSQTLGHLAHSEASRTKRA